MDFFKITSITILSTGTLMLLLYGIVLIHVYRGNKNPWLMIVVSIMY